MRISIDGCIVSFPEPEAYDSDGHPGEYQRAFTVAEATVASLLQMRVALRDASGPRPTAEPPASVKRLADLGRAVEYEYDRSGSTTEDVDRFGRAVAAAVVMSRQAL